jgi:hypothetical protein
MGPIGLGAIGWLRRGNLSPARRFPHPPWSLFARHSVAARAVVPPDADRPPQVAGAPRAHRRLLHQLRTPSCNVLGDLDHLLCTLATLATAVRLRIGPRTRVVLRPWAEGKAAYTRQQWAVAGHSMTALAMAGGSRPARSQPDAAAASGTPMIARARYSRSAHGRAPRASSPRWLMMSVAPKSRPSAVQSGWRPSRMISSAPSRFAGRSATRPREAPPSGPALVPRRRSGR